MKDTRTPRLSDLIRQPRPRPVERSAPKATAPSEAAAGAEPKEHGAEPPPRASVEGAGGKARSASPAPPPQAVPIEPTPPEIEARRDYELLEDWLARILARARQEAFEPGDVFETVKAILERPKLLDALFAETFKLPFQEFSLPRKSLNLAIYALRLAKALRYTAQPLVDLGAAAFLSKIGLARLPEELLLKPQALSRRELAAVRQHPELARRMIATLDGRFERVAEIVFQANERSDGSGYPHGLKEDGILREALIIGLADVFEALIQPRPHRDRLLPFDAAKEILGREKNRFPRALLREFIVSFSVFPPFTYVRLNSRAVARVVETEEGYPLRPRVEVVVDAGGRKPAKPQIVRLRESPLLYITGAVSGDELPA